MQEVEEGVVVVVALVPAVVLEVVLEAVNRAWVEWALPCTAGRERQTSMSGHHCCWSFYLRAAC